MFMLVALNEHAKRAKILWTITDICSNPGSPQELRKNDLVRRDLMQTIPHGPMIWKVMQRNAWSGVANWQTKQLSNCTKLQLYALMTINSKKNWDPLDN